MPTSDSADGNGLKSFSIHVADVGAQPTFAALAAERSTLKAFAEAPVASAALDPETAARRFLDQALQSDRTPGFAAPVARDTESRFKLIGTETLPLTGTRTVKFRQTLDEIPIYGSLVTVELDDDNELVSLNSALGEPSDIAPVARISASQAAAAVASKKPFKKQIKGIAPRLHYFFDGKRQKWRLVFIFENVPAELPPRKGKTQGITPRLFDYVVDAHTGTVVEELPRTPSMASEVQQALDARGVARDIRVETTAGRSVLRDSINNITTYDFAFADPDIADSALPGSEISPAWPAAAVSAHANASQVAVFLHDVVKRNGIDGRGGAMNASVNCVVVSQSPDGKQWANAYWNGRQMVYGQVLRQGTLLTLAASLDIVGHEMFHGVTDNTSRLEYARQSGALNESYSDIFGTIIANRGESDPRRWDWRLGNGFGRGGGPMRDLSDPMLYRQPAHMHDFVLLPNTRGGDWGGVHTNSGIHNKAAYLVLVAEDGAGLIFTPEDVAAIFYLAVTQQLSRTSMFSDSRRGVTNAARTLFRRSAAAEQARKIGAIDAAFDAVGIS